MREILKKHSRESPARFAVSGPTGCGKSVLLQCLIEEHGFDVVELTQNSSMKQMEDEFNNVSMSKTIEAFFMPKKRLLLIHDIDILLSSFTRLSGFLSEWLENTSGNRPAFACTINSYEEKRLGDFKKSIEIIKLSRPSSKDILIFFSKYLDTRSIAYDDARLLELIKSHKNDVRAVYTNLDQLGETTPIQSLRSTFSDMSMFDVQDKIFSRPLTKNELSSIIYSDSKLLGLLLYENAPVELQKNRVVKNVGVLELVDRLKGLTNAFLFQDQMETYMNTNVIWDMLPLMNHHMFSSIGNVIHHYPRVTVPKSDFEFTSMMTKTAMRFQYAKKKQAFMQYYNISPKHFNVVANGVVTLMNKQLPKECTYNLPKDVVDVAVKWGSDADLITAAKGTSWKKHIRKKDKLSAEDDFCEDE